MKDRHWDRIAKATGHTFDLESDNFMLRNIMEAPLLPNKEDIEVGCLFEDFQSEWVASLKSLIENSLLRRGT